MLKPQDVVVLCKLVSLEAPQVPIHRLAAELKMSPSEVHHAIHRGVEARLVEVVEHRTLAHEKRVNRAALLELCLTGLKYVFPVQPLSHARGMPTGWAAPMLHGAEAHPGALPRLADRGRPGDRGRGAAPVPVRARGRPAGPDLLRPDGRGGCAQDPVPAGQPQRGGDPDLPPRDPPGGTRPTAPGRGALG